MKVQKLTITDNAYPQQLKDISSPPKELYYIGKEPADWIDRPKIAIIGTRGVTPYGKAVTEEFAYELAKRGFVIISGLALGVDSVAHTAALRFGGTHVAIIANGLDKIYPATNTALARKLLQNGGTIISEYPEGTPSFKQHFIARNRIISGLSDAILITEAAEASGTLHTARFALDQGKDVMVVPGNITSPASVGCNNLIKSGALPVCSIEDILNISGNTHLTSSRITHIGDNAEEQAILDQIYLGISDAHEIMIITKIAPDLFAQTLTMLELSGKIRPLGNNQWTTV